MSVIRLNHVTKRFDDKVILRDASFRLSEGERVGLIGKNGSGKTTVLRMILDREEPTEGVIDVKEGTRIGYFSQFSELATELSIREILDGLFAELHEMRQELRTVEAKLTEPLNEKELERTLDRHAELTERFEGLGGWDYEVQIETALSKLSFNDIHRELPTRELSGGWRNRAALAKILLEDPDALLLDEPTNFLDVHGLEWLEQWCRTFRGAILLVTHDRDFLDAVSTRLVEIENYNLHEYPGSYADYVRKRKRRLRTIERQFQHEEELLIFEQEAIKDREEARRDPSGRLKRKLANVKKQVEPKPVDRIVTRAYEGLRTPTVLCRVEGLTKGYDGQTLFEGASFELHQGEKAAIIGRNGCGKTTLLRVLTELEEADAGKVSWGVGDIPYVYYNDMIESLDPTDTPSHAVNVIGMAYSRPRKRINGFLSLFQFSELDMCQKIGTLSGGQRARVALAMCLLSGAPVVILDEPTNHLDMASAQVMERALAHFPGGVIVVSHDRFFVDKVATRLIVFEDDGGLRFVTGNWSTWKATEAASSYATPLNTRE